MSTLIRLRRTAHLPGGTEGVLFFPAESGQSPMATLEPPASGAHPAIPAGEYPLRLDVVSPRFARSPRRWSAAWGGAIAAPDAGAGTRGNFDSPRQSTRRFFGLCANWPRGVSPSPGGECGDVPPLDACAPPSAASAADPGGGLRVSRAPDPPTLRVAASLTGLPPVALGLFPVTPMPLALACFCLGQNVCFIPRKKLHLLV